MKKPEATEWWSTPWSRVRRDDEVGVRRRRAFQKTIVGLVTNDVEFGQGITDAAAFDDFNDEIGPVAQHVPVLIKNGRTRPRVNQAGTHKFKDECGRVVFARKRGEFQMQVSRTTLKVGPGSTQCPRTSLGFHERNRFLFAHRLAAVFAVGPCQCRREFEPANFPFHYSCRH